MDDRPFSVQVDETRRTTYQVVGQSIADAVENILNEPWDHRGEVEFVDHVPHAVTVDGREIHITRNLNLAGGDEALWLYRLSEGDQVLLAEGPNLRPLLEEVFGG